MVVLMEELELEDLPAGEEREAEGMEELGSPAVREEGGSRRGERGSR